MENLTSDYTIYSNISDKNTYAINSNEVLKMNEIKKEYTNGIVPDTYKVIGFLATDVKVTNNKIVSFKKSDTEIELQINKLKTLLIS